jgi:hypothetical protein
MLVVEKLETGNTKQENIFRNFLELIWLYGRIAGHKKRPAYPAGYPEHP